MNRSTGFILINDRAECSLAVGHSAQVMCLTSKFLHTWSSEGNSYTSFVELETKNYKLQMYVYSQ